MLTHAWLSGQVYIEGLPDDGEVFLERIFDRLRLRFPFLHLSPEWVQSVADMFDSLYTETAPLSEEELAELAKKREADQVLLPTLTLRQVRYALRRVQY